MLLSRELRTAGLLLAGAMGLSGCGDNSPRPSGQFALQISPSGKVYVLDTVGGWLFDCSGTPDGVTDACRVVGVPGDGSRLHLLQPPKPLQ
jgi:hypothetical protein